MIKFLTIQTINMCLDPLRAGWASLCLVSVATSVFSQAARPFEAPSVNVAKNINIAIKAERLNSRVNTAYNEFGPMPTKDGKRLYFSRQGSPANIGGVEDEDIWYSEFDEGTQSWMEAINIGTPLNNSGP